MSDHELPMKNRNNVSGVVTAGDSCMSKSKIKNACLHNWVAKWSRGGGGGEGSAPTAGNREKGLLWHHTRY